MNRPARELLVLRLVCAGLLLVALLAPTRGLVGAAPARSCYDCPQTPERR